LLTIGLVTVLHDLSHMNLSTYHCGARAVIVRYRCCNKQCDGGDVVKSIQILDGHELVSSALVLYGSSMSWEHEHDSVQTWFHAQRLWVLSLSVGSLVTFEASIISYSNGNNSTYFARGERWARHTHVYPWHVQSETVGYPQLEGVGSIRRQLHMIFHFVEMGRL
jgi:hypothetical protein